MKLEKFRFNLMLLFFIVLIMRVIVIFPNEITTEPSVSEQITEKILVYVFYTISGFFFAGLSLLFSYLAVKFPKLADYLYELKELTQKEIERTEEKRKLLPDVLTAKQAIELKNETTERLINTKPAQELRRGVANIFGIFGGRAKEVGKQLFDNSVPGLIDRQVSKIKTKLWYNIAVTL